MLTAANIFQFNLEQIKLVVSYLLQKKVHRFVNSNSLKIKLSTIARSLAFK